MTEVIERFGSGEDSGLRAAVKATRVWEVERNSYLSKSSNLSEIDAAAPWDNVLVMAMRTQQEQSYTHQSFGCNAAVVDEGNVTIEKQFRSFDRFDPILSDADDGSCLTSAKSSCFARGGRLSPSDLKFDGGRPHGSGEFGNVATLAFQDGDLLAEVVQKSGPASNDDVAASCPTASSSSSETARPSLVRNLWPSSLTDRHTYEGTCSNQSSPHQIQRCLLPPMIDSSSPLDCERQSNFGSAEANFFVPFLPVTPCCIRDRRHLRYLFEKVLKPSDVGSLRRIVLPKRDAECHMPSLRHKEGIPFYCEDYITGKFMAFRYRFWPNNKSRMYVLENTGDFIRRHQLREADSIAIYLTENDSKYLIRPRRAQDL